jgi:pyridoxamine 5'-phosphate oxidase
MTQALADMRRDYTRDGLTEGQAPAEPFALFHQWFADAVKTEQAPVEANAMTLATVDADGRPHCRILLLKGLDEQGFTFFTNYESAKGQHLAANPFAAMTFFWPTLERQVRIEGPYQVYHQQNAAIWLCLAPTPLAIRDVRVQIEMSP